MQRHARLSDREDLPVTERRLTRVDEAVKQMVCS